MSSLGVVDNKAKLVAGTKTLHHLLPDLVVPMDNKWTGMFFQLQPPESHDPANQRRTFRRIHSHFAALASAVDPQRFATGEGWRTSRTKILDNALIAFCKREVLHPPAALETDPPRISFDVADYPPVKNEAKSLLSAGHQHADRVRALLSAAARARNEQRFEPVIDGPVELTVEIRLPAHGPMADLTNYLGGIVDVLQDGRPNVDTTWLGELTKVCLYTNDRQIVAVQGKIVTADEPGYRVTIV